MVLENIEPKEALKYFEEICAIPHGSRNTKLISDYCKKFADDRGLKSIQDEKGNVIIFKDGTFEGKDKAPLIIQGHIDMVCEKDNDCDIDMEKEGLSIYVEDDFIKAKGTTLGGDDGIAVAYALAILDSKKIVHPPLEVVLTVDEEIGMLGAAALDYSPLKGRTMLNLDSEEEGYLLVSCAGGVTATCHIKTAREMVEGIKATIVVEGLLGGHSGAEIDKGRANSNQIMGRVLFNLSEKMNYALVNVLGGLKDNAIPRETKAEIIFDKADENVLNEYIKEINCKLSNEFKNTDKDIRVAAKIQEAAGEGTVGAGMVSEEAFTEDVKKKVVSALFLLPFGIQKMSTDIEGLVETSLNMGILKTLENEVTMSFSVRSSIGSEKQELVEKMNCLMNVLGGEVTCEGEYPAWEYVKESNLRNLMADIYKEQTGKDAIIQAMHAGVECGLFAGNLPGLDCVSIGPDMYDIHTTKERLSISSVQRTWLFVQEILRKLSEG